MQQDAALNMPNGESSRAHNQIRIPEISIILDISYFLPVSADAGRIEIEMPCNADLQAVLRDYPPAPRTASAKS
jgi:hypothetical protein